MPHGRRVRPAAIAGVMRMLLCIRPTYLTPLKGRTVRTSAADQSLHAYRSTHGRRQRKTGRKERRHTALSHCSTPA